jgi:hypothetical protein
MDFELNDDIRELLKNAQDYPDFNDDLKVVKAKDLAKLESYLESIEGGIVERFERCHKCGMELDEDGFCKDLGCPYNDWSQDVPIELFYLDLTTREIFDRCQEMGLDIRIADEERRASSDLFECIDCDGTFDIEDSFLVDGGLHCSSCHAIYMRENDL